MLRKIFGSKRDEVTGMWRRLCNEELCDLFCSPSIFRVIKSRRIRWAGHVARMREQKSCIQGFVRKPEERRPFERPRRRWKVNIKMGLRKVGLGAWTGLIWFRIGTVCGLL